MRNPLLLAAAVAALSGCKTIPPPDQASAERFLDEQIAYSAASISQSQQRLHQTSAAPAEAAVASLAQLRLQQTSTAKPSSSGPAPGPLGASLGTPGPTVTSKSSA